MDKKLKAYSLFSSSKGNCSLISCGKDAFLIDAGVSCKRIEEALSALGAHAAELRGIFISHEHSDHTQGLATLSKRYSLPIYTAPECMDLISMTAPEVEGHLQPTVAGDRVYIGDIRVTVYPTPHDSVRSFCYRIESEGGSLGYATDIGHISDEVQDAIFGCDSVFIESNHDKELLATGPYPQFLKKRIAGSHGHLSNEACSHIVPVLARCGTRCITLAHLSDTNNTPDLAYKESRDRLKDYGVTLVGEAFAGDLKLQVAAPGAIVGITL